MGARKANFSQASPLFGEGAGASLGSKLNRGLSGLGVNEEIADDDGFQEWVRARIKTYIVERWISEKS